MPDVAMTEKAPESAVATPFRTECGPIEYRPFGEGYRIGNDGSVWTCLRRAKGVVSGYQVTMEWRRLKQTKDQTGYMRVAIRGKQYRVHTLVLEAFVGPRPSDYHCRHLDGRGDNNYLNNLAWGTPKENAADKIRHGTVVIGEDITGAKLSDTDVVDIRLQFANGVDISDLAKKYAVSRSAVHQVVYGKAWKHVGGPIAQEPTLTTICKHCGGPIEKPRKGKEYCKPKCRFAQWDKDHPRMVRWK